MGNELYGGRQPFDMIKFFSSTERKLSNPIKRFNKGIPNLRFNEEKIPTII